MPFLSPSAFATAMPSVMPMSSTVWCASMCRSPFALMVRSSAPCRASWSSMWSMNGMPEDRLESPRPSRSTSTRICVSLVSRWICALRMVSAERRGEGLEHPRVLVGGADCEPQAVCEEGMRAMEGANQYTTLPEALERTRTVGHAHQHEVRRRREPDRSGQRVERGLQPRALGHDGRGLAREDAGVGEQQICCGGAQGVHVVRHAQLLELHHPLRRADRKADSQSGEP